MNNYYETRYIFDEGRSKVWKAISEYLQQYVDKNSDCVVDIGAGYCDFINNIDAPKKIAVDINPLSAQYCAPGVIFYNSQIENITLIPDESVDVLFASNLLEHLDDNELKSALNEFSRILKKGSRVILMQPNFRYSYKEYFDDYTHKKIFTDISLRDFFESNGYSNVKVTPKFLPFSLKSKLPKSYILTKLYIASFYKPFAKQMLLVFKKM
jgi:ubiquinone/menaquinone biosynthesis C-methylase UbiE